MITGGLYFSLIRLICQMDTLFATARDNTISIIIEQSTKTILAWRSLFVSTLNHLEEIRKEFGRFSDHKLRIRVYTAVHSAES